MRRICLTAALFLFILPVLTVSAESASVLVLNSYHQGYEWSDCEINGLTGALTKSDPTVSISIEHLDLKRFATPGDEDRLTAFLADKYRVHRFDLAIVLDNPAFDLIRRHRDDLLRGVPVVFGGVNDFRPAMIEGIEGTTGVAEMQDTLGTLRLALALHPGTRGILAVHDYTSSGVAVRRELQAALPLLGGNVEIVFSPPATYQEAAEQVAELEPGWLAVILSFATDREGVSLPPPASTGVLTAKARVPVYAMHETRLGHGIVGGMLIGGEEHGRRVAAMALKILAGETPSALPVETQASVRPMFDFRQIERFSIALDRLPAGSIFVNRPVSFYAQNRTMVWSALAVLGVLLSSIGGLLVILQRKHRAEKSLRASEDRYRQLLDVLPDGVSVFLDERFVFVNPSTVHMLGAHSAEELLGRSQLEICHPDHREMAHARYRTCIEQGAPLPLAEFELLRLDGGTVTVESLAVPVDYQGRRALLGVWRNVSDRKLAEALLRASEERYRLLFDEMTSGFALHRMIFDAEGKPCDYEFLRVNPAFEKATGLRSAGILHRRVRDVLPGIPSALIERYGRVALTGAPDQFEHYSDQLGRYFEIRAFRPAPGQFATVFQDISDRKRALEALRQSESNFRLLVETAPEAIFVNCEGRFAYLNAAALRLFGAGAERELLGRALLERVHPEFHALVRERSRILMEELRPVPAIEQTYVRMDGAPVAVEVNAAPIQFQGRNGALVFARDITDRRQAEAALRESEEKYRLLVEHALDAIFITQDQAIKFPNRKAMEWFGLSAEELGQRSFEEFIHPEDRRTVIERHERRLRGQEAPNPNVFRIVSPKGGREFWVQVSPVLITWEGRPAGLNFVRDVTDQKKLEDQLTQAQKMEAIGTLAGGIAHDFNNILSVIMGNAEILEVSGAVEPSSRDSLQQILSAADRARQLVRQILAFSRHARQEKMPINLKPIVKETVEFLRASLPATIQLQHHVDPGVGQVLADPTQMQQVLMNLCTNAGHAMEADGGTLEIDLRSVELTLADLRFEPDLGTGRFVRLTVSDSGHGMDDATVQRIFEPYFTTKPKGKGTGLGLAVVHGIVTSHDGMIKVYSEPGKGTAFRVYFPQVQAAAAAASASPGPLPTGAGRILFVDDEPALAEISSQMLVRLGYQVDVRTSPVEALEAFRANPDRYDLVITDLTMPQMTGLRLARELTAIRPDLPILLCTGFSDQANEERAQAAGVRVVLLKPLIMRDLAEAAIRWVRPN